jgi:hypothetical protein
MIEGSLEGNDIPSGVTLSGEDYNIEETYGVLETAMAMYFSFKKTTITINSRILSKRTAEHT